MGGIMLFSERSIWTMVHGIGLGGGALLGLTATLAAFYLLRLRPGDDGGNFDRSGAVAKLAGFTAVTLWLATLVGTYVVFPPYRAAPPEGAVDLAPYPRSMIMADPSTAWLHSFAMETKEHLPFAASMLVTAVAFAAWRYRGSLLR